MMHVFWVLCVWSVCCVSWVVHVGGDFDYGDMAMGVNPLGGGVKAACG